MIFNIDKHLPSSLAAIDNNGDQITYGELCYLCKSDINLLPKRGIIFILCRNEIGAFSAYISAIQNEVVSLLLNASINLNLLENLIDIYKPIAIWLPESEMNKVAFTKNIINRFGYVLLDTGFGICPVHRDLELLMTTSGSTGSPKLVKYRKGNLEANAKNVSKVFGWTQSERPLCDLAMNYTMGLNVMNSHLYVGATLILTTYNIMSFDFWDYVKLLKVTNLTGVPFSYQIMKKLHFTEMDLPFLNTLAQGGGKLSDNLFKEFADYAFRNGKRFIATFGTTETSARLAFLPPEKALNKCGSIGKAIPEGELFLLDEDGNRITNPNQEGELAYRGPNVTMGYAVCREDLQREDEFCGEYHTGDIAIFDNEGYFYIVGRKARFIKLLSYRISLDQSERLINGEFGVECACMGNDECMSIYITKEGISDDVRNYISTITGIHSSKFLVKVVNEIPKNESGKIMYKDLA